VVKLGPVSLGRTLYLGLNSSVKIFRISSKLWQMSSHQQDSSVCSEPFAIVINVLIMGNSIIDYVYTEEVGPTMQYDFKKLNANPSRLALEYAFGAAFHKGLGAPLLSTTNKYVNSGSIEQYASQVYNKSNIALVASGAPHAELSKWTAEFFKDLKTGSKASGPATKYFGGEARVSSAAGSSYTIAFPGTPSSPNFKAEYKVLTYILGGETAVKWNAGFSLLSRAVAEFPGVSATAKQQHFTDAGLLYITVEGPDALLEKAGQAVVNAIHDVDTVGEEEVKKAIAQAKFDGLSEVEDRSIGLEFVGQSLLQSGAAPQADAVVKAIEAVTVDSVKRVRHLLLLFPPMALANTP